MTNPRKQDSAQKAPGEKKPRKGASVFMYLTVLFAVAFLLLLLAYFIQRRDNEVAVGALSRTAAVVLSSLPLGARFLGPL